VQIAKAMGAVVTAVDRGAKEALVRRLGADDFVDYTIQDVTATGRTFDVIFDMVAASPYRALVRMLDRGGRYLAGNPRLSVMVRSPFTTRFTDKTASVAFARETSEELLALKEMIEAGQIVSIVDRVYPMDQAADAHSRVETEERLGAMVLTITDDDGSDRHSTSTSTSTEGSTDE
jgi:NADPH:quinone reductase-like Zn-dependent oxidoreductase